MEDYESKRTGEQIDDLLDMLENEEIANKDYVDEAIAQAITNVINASF